jgi:hypothetical protein
MFPGGLDASATAQCVKEDCYRCNTQQLACGRSSGVSFNWHKRGITDVIIRHKMENEQVGVAMLGMTLNCFGGV